MRITTLFATAALAVVVAAPAFAQPPAGGPGGGGRGMLPDFATMDANKDGKVSKEEFIKALPEQAKERGEQMFTRRDANTDGSLSKEEAEAPGGRGGGRGPGGAPPAGQ